MKKSKRETPELGEIISRFKVNDDVWIVYDAWKDEACEHCSRYHDVKSVEMVRGRIEWVRAEHNWTWGRAAIHYSVRPWTSRRRLKAEGFTVGSDSIFPSDQRDAAAREFFRRQGLVVKRGKKTKRKAGC